MARHLSGRLRQSLLLLLVLISGCVVAQNVLEKVSSLNITTLSTQEIEEQLESCSIVKQLAAHAAASASDNASMLQRAFRTLFPFSNPAYNAFLGTLYISGPPNFLLLLVPTNVDPSSLNIMVAFAVGGILGDTLFHLLPEIFLGEVPQGEVKVRLVEPNKNLLLGVAIMAGFVTFVAMDKGLRIATGGQGHTHERSSHAHKDETEVQQKSTAASSGRVLENESIDAALRKRLTSGSAALSKQDSTTREIAKGNTRDILEDKVEPPKKEIKLSAYLNIVADFTHNITDGLALSSSFYASPTIGATTTLAVFCHEIPHEVGDFALLIQGGMDKSLAMGLQFVTALGAVVGTIIGVAVQEYGGSSVRMGASGVGNQGLWGTSLQWGDLLLPFTAGTFLYVGTVGVIPDMLETGPNKMQELRSMALQFLAMAAGAGIMLGISWS